VLRTTPATRCQRWQSGGKIKLIIDDIFEMNTGETRVRQQHQQRRLPHPLFIF